MAYDPLNSTNKLPLPIVFLNAFRIKIEELLESKMRRKGLTREEITADILRTATRPCLKNRTCTKSRKMIK